MDNVWAKIGARAQRQNERDVRVIFGNPPYWAEQDTANDNNQNTKNADRYPVR